MTKQEYTELRGQLDFKLRYGWLWIHLATDILLVGIPAGLLYYFWGEAQLNAQTIAVWTVCNLSLAIFYFRSFSMMHEAVHGTLSTNRRLNGALGFFYGAACFLPFGQWREIHLVHHYWAGNIEKDPVRKLSLVFKGPPTRASQFLSFMWKSWFPILALMQTYVFWFESARRSILKPTFLGLLGLILPLAAWGAIFTLAPWSITAVVLVPSILFYLALVEVVNFPHHTDLPQYEGEVRLALWDQHEIARSCFYPKLMTRFVLLNFNYHIEHHLYPTLPWYRLEALSQELRGRITRYNYSKGNEWILRNRRKPLEEVCTSTSSHNDEKKTA